MVVAEEYNDKWMRGMKLNTKEVGADRQTECLRSRLEQFVR